MFETTTGWTGVLPETYEILLDGETVAATGLSFRAAINEALRLLGTWEDQLQQVDILVQATSEWRATWMRRGGRWEVRSVSAWLA